MASPDHWNMVCSPWTAKRSAPPERHACLPSGQRDSLRPISILPGAGVAQGGDVAGKSRYAGRKFCLWGWIFPRDDGTLEQGSEEFLWVSHVVPLSCVVHRASHVVPLSCVVHQGEVGPAPIIIYVRKKQGFPMQPDQYEGGSHFDVLSEFLHSCCKW